MDSTCTHGEHDYEAAVLLRDFVSVHFEECSFMKLNVRQCHGMSRQQVRDVLLFMLFQYFCDRLQEVNLMGPRCARAQNKFRTSLLELSYGYYQGVSAERSMLT